MLDFIKSEPAMLMALVQAGLALGTSFGLHWSAEQVGAVMAFVAAFFGVLIRQTVTPNSKVG